MIVTDPQIPTIYELWGERCRKQREIFLQLSELANDIAVLDKKVVHTETEKTFLEVCGDAAELLGDCNRSFMFLAALGQKILDEANDSSEEF